VSPTGAGDRHWRFREFAVPELQRAQRFAPLVAIYVQNGNDARREDRLNGRWDFEIAERPGELQQRTGAHQRALVQRIAVPSERATDPYRKESFAMKIRQCVRVANGRRQRSKTRRQNLFRALRNS
jgi:hypothetical protein